MIAVETAHPDNEVRLGAWERKGPGNSSRRRQRQHDELPPVILGDDIADDLAVVDFTEDLIAVSQRYADTGQVGTVWLSRSQIMALHMLMEFGTDWGV